MPDIKIVFRNVENLFDTTVSTGSSDRFPITSRIRVL